MVSLILRALINYVQIHLLDNQIQINFQKMPSDSDDKFATFLLPDITKVDPTKIKKFSKNKNLPKWRHIAKGLNLQGICKNKSCQAYKNNVWTHLGYRTFFMSQQVCKTKCPMCQKPTKGNKKIGLYKCELTGRGMKVGKKNNDNEETDDECENATKETDAEAQAQGQQEQEDQQVQIEFNKIVCDSSEGILYMNGVNGPFAQWRYMTLQIVELNN